MTRISAQEELLISRAVARIRAGIMALVFGMVGGVGLFVATVWLLFRGGESVGPTLGLLGYYFPGYSVTPWGSIVGLVYGFVLGAIIGWSVARTYNRIVERRHRSSSSID